MSVADTHRRIEAVWRLEAPKLIATLTRLVRDVGLAEDLAQDALVAALEQWPSTGVPNNPAAWLLTIARHRGIDRLRRRSLAARKYREHGQTLQALEMEVPDMEGQLDRAEVEDDLLRLIFIACHPVLSPEARVALSLRLLGGLTTEEIARAFLVPEPTIAQRIVRAKKTLAAKKVPFELPQGPDLSERLSSVLSVIYLIFNEGYAATAGDDWLRPTLCEDAIRLGRIIAELMPGEPEVHGLVGLMEVQASRSAARVGPSGEAVLLLEQNRARWDRLLIRRGLEALARAERLGGANGPYALQAALAACHARAADAADTDWRRIADIYATLALVSPSPIVELNRAVAVGMAFGPEAGLAVVDALEATGTLDGYHRVASVRGDLLFKIGRCDEARIEFENAAAQTGNTAERALLLARARECATH